MGDPCVPYIAWEKKETNEANQIFSPRHHHQALETRTSKGVFPLAARPVSSHPYSAKNH